MNDASDNAGQRQPKNMGEFLMWSAAGQYLNDMLQAMEHRINDGLLRTRAVAKIVDREDVALEYLKELRPHVFALIATIFEIGLRDEKIIHKEMPDKLQVLYRVAEKYRPGIPGEVENLAVRVILDLPAMLQDGLAGIEDAWRGLLACKEGYDIERIRTIGLSSILAALEESTSPALLDPLPPKELYLARKAQARYRSLRANGATTEQIQKEMQMLYTEGKVVHHPDQLDDLPTLSDDPEKLGLR